MRKRQSVLGLLLAGAALATQVPVALAQERVRVPTRLSAFVPRSPLPMHYMQLMSDEHYTGCRGLPGSCHGQCEDGKFCRTLVSSNGKHYCGCSANPP
jgi:hypothetical protein